MQARRGVLQTTTDDGRRQRAKQYWLPILWSVKGMEKETVD